MRYGFMDDDIFEINMALQCKIKDMKSSHIINTLLI